MFKVKLPDEQGTTVVTESGENTTNEGQLDYCYVEQDKDYKVRLKEMERPDVSVIKSVQESGNVYKHEYIFQEISAPDEYELNRTPIKLTLEFDIKTDDKGNGKAIIKNAISSDNTRLIIKEVKEDRVNLEILNNKESKLSGAYRVTYNENSTE